MNSFHVDMLLRKNTWMTSRTLMSHFSCFQKEPLNVENTRNKANRLERMEEEILLEDRNIVLIQVQGEIQKTYKKETA